MNRNDNIALQLGCQGFELQDEKGTRMAAAKLFTKPSLTLWELLHAEHSPLANGSITMQSPRHGSLNEITAV
jgi:hypothetical protein